LKKKITLIRYFIETSDSEMQKNVCQIQWCNSRLAKS